MTIVRRKSNEDWWEAIQLRAQLAIRRKPGRQGGGGGQEPNLRGGSRLRRRKKGVDEVEKRRLEEERKKLSDHFRRYEKELPSPTGKKPGSKYRKKGGNS